VIFGWSMKRALRPTELNGPLRAIVPLLNREDLLRSRELLESEKRPPFPLLSHVESAELWEALQARMRGKWGPYRRILRLLTRRFGGPQVAIDVEGVRRVGFVSPNAEAVGNLIWLDDVLDAHPGYARHLDLLHKCPVCGVSFVAQVCRRYCSRRCRQQARASAKREDTRQRRASWREKDRLLGLEAPPRRCSDPRLLNPLRQRERVSILETRGLSTAEACRVVDFEIGRVQKNLSN